VCSNVHPPLHAQLFARILLLSTIILLPLLGGTWLLGLLFVIDNESVPLAWIFTIVNSFQVRRVVYCM